MNDMFRVLYLITAALGFLFGTGILKALAKISSDYGRMLQTQDDLVRSVKAIRENDIEHLFEKIDELSQRVSRLEALINGRSRRKL